MLFEIRLLITREWSHSFRRVGYSAKRDGHHGQYRAGRKNMSIGLFEHNQNAYQNAVCMMREYGRAAVIHPTGTGKSFIVFRLAEDNPGARICWLAPSEYIFLSQKENYLKAGGSEETFSGTVFLTYAKLMYRMTETREAGDDAYRGSGQAGKGSREAAAGTAAYAAGGQQLPSGMDTGDSGSGCLFSETLDYIILDEFHRCGAEGWGKGVEMLLCAYPDAKVLGLSATHIRYLDNRRDMAEELFGGHIASRMELSEAVSRGILPAPVYICGLYEYGNELKRLSQSVGSQRNAGVRDRSAKLLERLRHCLEQADGPGEIFSRHMKKDGKYIVFCSGREHMEKMISLAGKWYGGLDGEPAIYRAAYDNHESPEEVRRFQADQGSHLKLLFCIDMLNEGIHVADVDGAVLLRPTASPILYLQQVGRALSVPCGDEGRQPVIFDMVDNFDGLRCIDSFLEEYRKVKDPGETHRADRPSHEFRVIDEARESRKLFEQLRRCLASSWDACFREAEAYYAEHGNLRVPKRYITENGIALGSWLMTQRRVRAGAVPGNLSGEQIGKLDGLGMVWDSCIGKAWETGYQELLNFRKENGHVDVPARYVTEDGYPLGRFVSNQRAAWRNGREASRPAREKILQKDPAQEGMPQTGPMQGKIHQTEAAGEENGFAAGDDTEGVCRVGRTLTKEKKRRLDAIGFIWDRQEQDWERYYAAAKAFYEREGCLDIPAKYVTEDGIPLGSWIRRRAMERDSLPDGRVKALEAIGMAWGSCYDSRWDEKFRLAEQYYRDHGNLEIPREYTVQGVRLGRWIHALRGARLEPGNSHYRLDEERIRQLDSIGMRWKEDPWEIRYHLAEQYYREHGNLKMAQTYVAEKDGARIWLGKWLAEQRKKHGSPDGRHALTEEQERRLEAIGMEW